MKNKTSWNDLNPDMRVRGHVPNTFVVLLDIEDSENVRFLFWHSGRLAVVFGLMQT